MDIENLAKVQLSQFLRKAIKQLWVQTFGH